MWQKNGMLLNDFGYKEKFYYWKLFNAILKIKALIYEVEFYLLITGAWYKWSLQKDDLVKKSINPPEARTQGKWKYLLQLICNKIKNIFMTFILMLILGASQHFSILSEDQWYYNNWLLKDEYLVV